MSMDEGFRIKPGEEKDHVTFQGIEMVTGPMNYDVEKEITAIRNFDLFHGKKGFGEMTFIISPEKDVWPSLSKFPASVKDVFAKALTIEQNRNPEINAYSCHMSVRIQGSDYAKKSKKSNVGMHFDGSPVWGEMSGYIVSFSTPGTIQYLGETTISTGTRGDLAIAKELKKIKQVDLTPVSLLPGRLYHITSKTPHAVPSTMDGFVTDERPRLFMRIMFARFDPSKIGGNIVTE